MNNVFKILAVSAIVLGSAHAHAAGAGACEAMQVDVVGPKVMLLERRAFETVFVRLSPLDGHFAGYYVFPDHCRQLKDETEPLLEQYVFVDDKGAPVTHKEAYVQYLQLQAIEFLRTYDFNGEIAHGEEIYGQHILELARLQPDEREKKMLSRLTVEADRRWRLVGLPE